MPDLNAVTQWIEDHQATVDLAKWLLVLALAWAAGLFRYVRNLTRTPRLSISSVTSRCYVEEQPFESHSDAMKAAFLLDIEVTNRSSEKQDDAPATALESQVLCG